MKVQAIDGPVILRQFHVITYNENDREEEMESLLCINQCRDYGSMIDECAQRYGGLQCMVVKDEENNNYVIPFDFLTG